MGRFRRIGKPVSHLVVLGLLAMSIHVPAVNAGIVGTEAIANAAQAQYDRERVQQLLSRAEIKDQLLARGVDPDQVQARVNSLTDTEIQNLTAKIDQLPAGGDSALGILLFIFIVLLITDILGFTDIFPFVKKPARR